MQAAVAILATAASLAFLAAAPARAASHTTDPTTGLEYVFVTMTDSKIAFTAESAYCCDAPNRSPGMPRAWAKIAFRVTNNGKMPHNFSIYGKTSGKIAPGKTVNTTVYNFLYRGRYIYRSTLNPSPTLHGVWTVY